MIRNLLIISGVGLILAVVGISGAAALGGRDLAKNDWTWTVTDNEFGDGEGESFRMRRGPAEPDVTRTLAWTGGDRLQVEVPGDVVYIQGPEAGVVVTGPKALADRVRVAGGRLTIDDEADRHVERGYIRWSQNGIHVWSENDRLKITVTAPSVTTFEVTSSADLVIRDYDQPRLNLTISGSGEVTARGEAESVRIDISGSGDAELAAVRATDADVSVWGSGDVSVAPTRRADVSISGSGDVDITTRPETVTEDISGSGDLSIRGERTERRSRDDEAVTVRTTTTTREIVDVPGVSVRTTRTVPAP